MRLRLNSVGCGVLTFCLLALATSGTNRPAMGGDEQETAAAGVLKKAIQQNRGESPAEIEALKQAAKRASEKLPDDHYARKMIETALTEAQDCDDPAECHRTMLSRVHESLTFEPTMEAKLPRGYPQPTPVHKIEIKQLPAYRMAVAKMQGKNRQNSAFFELFNHIKRNDIAMTAPVEMEYSSEGVDQGEASMAFLYREPELGQAGVDPVDDDVTVVDVPAMTVVSIGVRGRCDDAAVKRAEMQLRSWLADNQEYEACGELRRLGYNSPMIPSFMKYSEVQLPVCKTETASKR